jgi:hypothetical protein
MTPIHKLKIWAIFWIIILIGYLIIGRFDWGTVTAIGIFALCTNPFRRRCSRTDEIDRQDEEFFIQQNSR